MLPRIDEQLLKTVFCLFLLAVAVLMAVRSVERGAALDVALAAFGVLAGVASGLLGVGGGTLMVPFLTLAAGYSQHVAEATSLLVILPTAIVGSLALRHRGIGDRCSRSASASPGCSAASLALRRRRAGRPRRCALSSPPSS